MKKSLNSLYEDYIYNSAISTEKAVLFEQFWGKIPKDVGSIANYINRNQIPRNDRLDRIEEQEKLLKIISTFHENKGFLTPEVRKLLGDWFNSVGTIECGHQPLYLGGSSFLLNKLSFTSFLSSFLSSNHSLTPIFFLGDHDEIQNELTIARVPQSKSPSGLELKISFDSENILTPMHQLEKPKLDLLLDHIEKIQQNYKNLFKYSKIKLESRGILEHRLEESLGLIYESYIRSGSNFSDWIIQILADILLLKNKMPLLILPGSDIELRKLMLPYMENLLKEENRASLVTILNEKNRIIEENNFKAGISIRDPDYVPFFLECPNHPSRDRIRLTTDNSTLTGTCPRCNETFNISYDSDKPDLYDHYRFLSPRVESRSIIMNDLLLSNIRVTGGGETSYCAQIIPYIRSKSNSQVPLIIKHPRVYYNTPWSEKKAEELKDYDSNLDILQKKENFIRMSSINRANNKDEIKELILETKKEVTNVRLDLNKLLDIIKEKEDFGKNRNEKKIFDLVSQYLSITWGQFSPTKNIQEVSWLWIDLVLLTGLRDITGFYQRPLNKNIPISPVFWLSAGKFS